MVGVGRRLVGVGRRLVGVGQTLKEYSVWYCMRRQRISGVGGVKLGRWMKNEGYDGCGRHGETCRWDT